MPERLAQRSREAGPARIAAAMVVPNWIRNFGDPELTALVADAVERNPDLKAAAARVEASRAAVRVAASSLYPRIAMKGLGERQGQRLSGDLGRDINPPSFGRRGTENTGGRGSIPAWINRHSVGYMASQPGRMGGRRVGAHSLEKSCREGGKLRAGSRLRICPAIPRRCRGARVFHYDRSRATGSERAGNARYLPGVFKTHRRAQTAGFCERLRRVANQVAHRRRRGCALRRTGGAGADDSRHRGRHQSLSCRQI